MQKVYTRKRAKKKRRQILNPFQSSSSFPLKPIHIIPLLAVSALIAKLCIFIINTTFLSGNDVPLHDHYTRTGTGDDDDRAFHLPITHNTLISRAASIKNKLGLRQKRAATATIPVEPLSSFQNENDPNLHTMIFKKDDEEITFPAYVQPHISTFYQNNDPQYDKQKMPRFSGHAGKFFNLSNERLTLYWGGNANKVFMAEMPPFEVSGTATFPGHRFFLCPKDQTDDESIRHRFNVIKDQLIYVYDPYYNDELDEIDFSKIEEELNKHEKEKYFLQRNSLAFGKAYQKFTGREWLSLYPLRKQPQYKMWNADYFGQEHWVISKETHYVIEPPENLLQSLNHDELHSSSHEVLDRNRHLADYREKNHDDIGSDGEPFLNMTVKVLSCAPRVFEIKNFLSQVEVDHIIHMATGMKLSLSTTSASDGSNRRADKGTRTSKNSWVNRSKSPIIDSIYRRAADLMLIDEAMLRSRDKGERPDIKHTRTQAEDLQLVHYDVSEQYTAHHDFSYPSTSKTNQPARFATILFYLNEGMRGGETTFPKWVNGETHNKLSVVPEIGKAVLFYSMLPDGNMDDLSQHAAEPVIDGEKWLINLWTWDPIFR